MKQTTKPLNLPKPIAAYFTADKGDGEAVSQCFTENAVVKDEGHTHKKGHEYETSKASNKIAQPAKTHRRLLRRRQG